MTGWIKLHRKLKDWQWYDDHNATRLLIHLLISVNYEEKKWMGITIKPGSMAFSWETLSIQCGLSVMQCRTAMDKLISSKEVTREVTNKYQLITLVKWEELQSNDNQLTAELTNKQQANNKQITTTKEDKEIKEKNSVPTKEEKIKSFKNSIKETNIYKSGKYPVDMFIHFTEYWTAETKSKKLFFETQKTFSFQARLRTWINNDQKYRDL